MVIMRIGYSLVKDVLIDMRYAAHEIQSEYQRRLIFELSGGGEILRYLEEPTEADWHRHMTNDQSPNAIIVFSRPN